jgi:hypothetical protein
MRSQAQPKPTTGSNPANIGVAMATMEDVVGGGEEPFLLQYLLQHFILALFDAARQLPKPLFNPQGTRKFSEDT